MLPKCQANSARFAAAQLELGRPQNIELKWQKIDKKRLEVLQPPTEEPCGDVNPPLSMKGYHGTMIGEALTQKKDKGISSYVQDECC